MRRNRFVTALLLLTGIAALFYFGAALYLPSSQRLMFGVDKQNGEIRRVESGITYLPWHRYYRMEFDRREGGDAVTSGQIALRSRDGVPVRMTYRLRFGIPAERIPDTETLISQGWSGWLRSRVSEAVSVVLSEMPIEEIASPTADYGRRRQILREVVARYLSRSGVRVSSFDIEAIHVDRDALLAVKRNELRRNARGAMRNVAVFTIEGADWELIKELVDDGRLPNLGRMIAEGNTATVQSLQPAAAPMTWTTMMTGLSPDRHGVIGYFEASQPESPVSARSRTAPAVWEVAEAFGRPAAVINGWTSWPPSPGVTTVGTPPESGPPPAHPEEMQPLVRQVNVERSTVGADQIRRFVNVTSEDLQEISAEQDNPVSLLRNALADTWTTHRAALQVYQKEKPALLVVNYSATDTVNHLFSPFHPPYREGVSYSDYRSYWPGVANFYSEIDRLIGEWLETLDPGTAVLVNSTHGFQWGRARQRAWSSRIGSIPQHSAAGVLIAWGERVVPSNVRRSVSILDIAPTILGLMGLPKSAEMPGQVLNWMFEDLHPIEGVRIDRYDEYVDREPVAAPGGAAPEPYRQALQQIGHVIDPSQIAFPQPDAATGDEQVAQLSAAEWGRYAWLNNHAIDLRQEKKIDEALRENAEAIALNPSRPTPYLNRALLLIERDRYTDAEDALFEAIRRNLPNGEQYVLDMAAWYRANDLTSRAINLLERARSLFPNSHRIAANRGAALAAVQRYTDANAELQRALQLQPSSTLALNTLGNIAMRGEDWGSALDYWNRSLTVDPRQPKIREAAEAVRTRL